MEVSGLFTWTALASLVGAATMVYIIVGFTKQYIPFSTDLFGSLVGALILFGAGVAQGEAITWQMILLCIFNGFIVQLAAGKMNDKAVTEFSKKNMETVASVITPLVAEGTININNVTPSAVAAADAATTKANTSALGTSETVDPEIPKGPEITQ